MRLLRYARNDTTIKGLTLVELMVNMLIISFIGTTVSWLFIKGFQMWQLNRVKIEIQRDARTSLDIMNKYLRQAKASSVVISKKPGQPVYSWLRFNTVDVDTSGYVVQRGTVDFYQDGTTLYEIFNEQQIIITKQLLNVMFTYPQTGDSSLIKISICFEGKTYSGGTKALQLSVEKVRLMN